MFNLLSQHHILRAPIHEGRAGPGVGPSDSTDSASDLPAGQADTDSDASGTGERESVDPFDHIAEDAELGPDAIVDEEQAGISHDRPNPERNGAVDPRDGGDQPDKA